MHWQCAVAMHGLTAPGGCVELHTLSIGVLARLSPCNGSVLSTACQHFAQNAIRLRRTVTELSIRHSVRQSHVHCQTALAHWCNIELSLSCAGLAGASSCCEAAHRRPDHQDTRWPPSSVLGPHHSTLRTSSGHAAAATRRAEHSTLSIFRRRFSPQRGVCRAALHRARHYAGALEAAGHAAHLSGSCSFYPDACLKSPTQFLP